MAGKKKGLIKVRDKILDWCEEYRCVVFRIWSNISEGAFCENSSRLKAVNYFRNKAPWLMFDRVLNILLESAQLISQRHHCILIDVSRIRKALLPEAIIWCVCFTLFAVAW